MKLSYLTLFPDLIKNYFSEGLISKAVREGLIHTEIYNIRDAVTTSYKTVDDTAYGGGEGTVMMCEPLKKTLDKALLDKSDKKTRVIYLSPQGRVLDQSLIHSLLHYDHLVLISGRYAGVDQRFIHECVDLEVSIGDYVLNGGELPSLVLTEALARFIPGVLGHELSAQNDSFAEGLGGWLEAPQFTKPSQVQLNQLPSAESFKSTQLTSSCVKSDYLAESGNAKLSQLGQLQVPEVLLSGNHKKIAEWKSHVSKLVTLKKRQDLFNKLVVSLSKSEIAGLKKFYTNELSADDKKILQIENLDEALNKL